MEEFTFLLEVNYARALMKKKYFNIQIIYCVCILNIPFLGFFKTLILVTPIA